VYLSFSAFFSLLTSVLLTKNKRIMTQMREERNLLGAILENNADGWCEWNMRRPDEHYLSPKLKSVLGYEDHEIPNNREGLNMLIHPDDRHMVDCIMKEQLEGRGDSNISLEIRHVHKSGETRWALCKAKAFKDEIGGLKRIIGLHIDISYQKSMEDELRSAKLDAEAGARAKADFLARMSHEIRTPLNGIIGLISMFGSTKLDEKQMEMHGLLRQSSQTLLDLLNDILDLAKLEASEDKVEPVQLKDVVESVVGLFWARAGDKGLYLTAHVPRDAHVRVNKSKLMQVLVNLVSNAIKYTKTGGIRVSAERTGSDELTFTIADSGIGISPGEIERIFDEYHQGSAHVAKRFGGTGLGLAICKELTEAMGGRIWVKSRLGVGSTFCFTVRGEPVPKVPVKASRALTNDQTFSMLKVLVVEDYPVNQKVAMYNFQCLGIHPEVVNNGKEALEHPRLNEFDAVFMDVHMPIMDGYEAAAQIRRRAQDRSRPKIIAMTAYALKGDRERCVEAGMDDYIAKPIDAQSLFSCLGRHFGKADCIPVTFNAKEVRARFADSKTLLLEVLKGSELSYGACIQEMKNAVSSGDATRLGAAVHKLRGGLLTFGQNEVVEKLRQVEHSAREDGVVSLTESEVDILREQIRSLMDQLHHFAETIGEMPDAPRPEVHP
jgi:PAS domain S-box-containing protein